MHDHSRTETDSPDKYPTNAAAAAHSKAIRALGELLIRELDLLELAAESNDGQLTEQFVSLEESVERFEKGLIRQALIRTGGHQTDAAKILGLKVSTFHSKLKRYEIESRLLAPTKQLAERL